MPAERRRHAPRPGNGLEAVETAPIRAAAERPAVDRIGNVVEDTDRDRRSGPAGRPRRLRRRLLIGSLTVLALLLVAAGGGFWRFNNYAGNVDRIPDVFASIPQQERPDKPASGQPGHDALTFLLAGTDRRSDVPTTGEDAEADQFVQGAQRTDTIMLLHLTADRRKAYVISIPRDSWVPIPGRGTTKVNAAYSLGGPSLYVRTIEQLTGIRIDHLAVIDWSGFTALVDAVGGVTVTVPQAVYDSARKKMWTAGPHHLDGAEALLYVRQRYGLPGGDFDRVKRQQNFLRALMNEALSQGTLANPLRLNRVLDAVTEAVSVDDTLDNGKLRGLALSLRNLRQNDLTFLTVPTRGIGREGSASVVYIDERRAQALWNAVRRDDLPTYLKRYGKASELLGTRPR